ncbi:carbohydrate-binding family 9-like protein [Arcticibacter tournemirensis]
MLKNYLYISVLTVFLVGTAEGQVSFKGLDHLFTEPRHYVARFVTEPPVIDGNIEDDIWRTAPWTDFFKDIEGNKKPNPALKTRVKMLWNDSCLFIAAELEEPHVWANLSKHDQVVFHDNDFEVFIDPDNNTHQYFEIEVNALNTIFDLFLSKPYRNNSGALISWDAPGLRSAVKVLGTINRPYDTDKGWTVEMAIPFKAVTIGNDTKVPAEGDLWRINFSRVEWDCEVKNGNYRKKRSADGKPLPEHNWVWSPQGVINMHYPERWGYVQFSKGVSSVFSLPYNELQRRYLWLVYYRQKEYFGRIKRYAKYLKDLGINPEIEIDGKLNRLTMLASSSQFCVTIDSDGGGAEINEEGLIQILRTE